VRRLFPLVGAIVFVDTMFFTALTPLLPHYADRFELSKLGAGVLSAAYPLGVLVGGIPSGIATGRFGPRAVTITGLLMMAGTTLAFGLAGSIVVLDAARFAQGLASSCAWTAGLAWLVGAAPAGRRGALIGSAMAAAVVGALFGPVLGWVASATTTGVAFGVVGGIALGLAAWAAATERPTGHEAQPVQALFDAVRTRAVAGAIWFVVLPALLFGTLSVLAPLRLHELGGTSLLIGGAYLLAAAFEAVVNPVLGRVSDRTGRLLPIRAGLIGSALVASLLPWPDDRYALAALVVAAGIAFGSFWTPAMSHLSDTGEALGLGYAYSFALINLAWAPGQAIGSTVSGALADLTSDTVPYLLLAGTCLLTFAALWRSTASS
jgi:MFS family permease